MKKIVIDRHDCSREESQELVEYLAENSWDWKEVDKPSEKAHYRKFSQRQQTLIKMAAAMKIKHFKLKETVSYFGEDKCQAAIDEYEEILVQLTRT